MNFPYTKSTECYYCAGGITGVSVQRVQAGEDIGVAQHKPGCPVVELAKERIGQPWPEMPATPIDEEVTKERQLPVQWVRDDGKGWVTSHCVVCKTTKPLTCVYAHTDCWLSLSDAEKEAWSEAHRNWIRAQS